MIKTTVATVVMVVGLGGWWVWPAREVDDYASTVTVDDGKARVSWVGVSTPKTPKGTHIHIGTKTVEFWTRQGLRQRVTSPADQMTIR